MFRWQRPLLSLSAFRPAAAARRDAGFTLLELLVVCFIVGIFLKTAVSNLSVLNRPLNTNLNSTVGFFQQVRSRAMSATRAYTITPSSVTRLTTTSGKTCTSAQTAEPSLSLTFTRGAQLTSTAWSICFSSRGIASAAANISLQDTQTSATKQIEVFLGGGMRVYP